MMRQLAEAAGIPNSDQMSIHILTRGLPPSRQDSAPQCLPSSAIAVGDRLSEVECI